MKSSRKPETSRKPGAQPGNHNAYKHGRYARTPDLATQLFFPAGRTRVRDRHAGVFPCPSHASSMKTILVEGVPVRIPTHEEIAWLDTLPTAEFLAEMKRIWVIMAIDTLQFPDLPLKDVLYLARRIAEWIRQ